MPKLLRAREPQDAAEDQRKVRRLAGSRHAPGRLDLQGSDHLPLSWRGLRTSEIADAPGLPPQDGKKAHPPLRCPWAWMDLVIALGLAVSHALQRMSAPRSSPWSPQLLAGQVGHRARRRAPRRRREGRLLTDPDALAEAANEMGIEVGRSQVRRILLAEGVRWRRTRPWAESPDPEFVPKDRG